MSKITKDGILENFQAIKNNFGEYQRSKKENFEFDVNIDTDFADPANGKRFVLDVAEGTTAGLVEPYLGIRGKQDMQLIKITPSWQTDGQTAVTSAGVGKFDGDVAAGDIDLDDVTLDVEQEYFQVKVNPYALDKTIYGLETGSSYDPNLAAASYIMESAQKEMRNRVATRFFTGFGSSAGNGLEDLTFSEQGTGAAITEATILGRMSELADAVAATDAANKTTNVILLHPKHFQWYVNAVVKAQYGDFINQRSFAGHNETLSSLPFIYNPSITVISDQTYATEKPLLFQTDRVFFGTTALAENEMPDLWYSKDFNTYFVRGIIYGGVQTIDNSGFFSSDITA